MACPAGMPSWSQRVPQGRCGLISQAKVCTSLTAAQKKRIGPEFEDPCGTRLSDLVTAKDGTAWASSAGSGHYPGACVAYYSGEHWVETTQDHGLSAIAALALDHLGEVAARHQPGARGL